MNLTSEAKIVADEKLEQLPTPPNLRRCEGCCGICKHFASDVAMGFCVRYQFPVSKDETCDVYERR